MEIKPFDCAQNKDLRPVSYAQALRWNYNVGAADLQKLLSFLLDAVNGGEIGLGSLKAATGDLLSIPGLDTKGQALAGQIDRRVAELLQEYIVR